MDLSLLQAATTTLRVWDAKTGKLVAGQFSGHKDAVRSVAFSAHGEFIVFGSYDRYVGLTGPAHRKWLVKGRTGQVSSCAFESLGDEQMRVPARGKTLRIWNIKTGGPVTYLTSLRRVKGGCIIAGTNGGSIYMWKRNWRNFII
jgi:WD40 repeat protein